MKRATITSTGRLLPETLTENQYQMVYDTTLNMLKIYSKEWEGHMCIPTGNLASMTVYPEEVKKEKKAFMV